MEIPLACRLRYCRLAVAFLWMAEAKPDEPDKETTAAADPMRGKAPGEVRDDNALKLKLVWCPPGILTMEQVEYIEDDPNTKLGSEETTIVTPVKVLLTQGYWLGQYEVTQSEWKQLMKTEPWKVRRGQFMMKDGADFPAIFVSWNDATDFCRNLTEQERKAGRLPKDWEYTLPTEAQWERACRARTETKYSFGDDGSKLGDYAWFADNAGKVGEEYAHKVGQKKANPWGLFDMHGNVYEWCRDVFTEKLPGGRDPEVKPEEITQDSDRVHRGGCFQIEASYCRSAVRMSVSPSGRGCFLGFRVALSPVR